ncbi:SCO family protein [Lacisediminimonas sp.]|uniref:SCO family protein n=1 Tax=Lacisediminimonas sp. TaxID=3060582 RepID=UPI0027244B6D|nr:SCO family protein [Lacisediminimonas sp.]MDO8300925.1 SCO family protein [Lacisediminimonas sp.]MDO9217389.1 SCO family protein [Lacisediminimonas sp.]
MNLSKREFLRAAGGAALVPVAAAAAAEPLSRPASAAYDSGERYFTNAILTAHDGRKLRFFDDVLKDKLVVINMMYTTCSGICPASTATVKAVQKALGSRVGRDIFFYSISLRPEFDTPAALRQYRERHDITNSWTFLTGSGKDIDLIRRRLGFYDIDPAVDADLSQHTGMLRIGKVSANRWSMVPSATTSRQIVSSILGVA